MLGKHSIYKRTVQVRRINLQFMINYNPQGHEKPKAEIVSRPTTKGNYTDILGGVISFHVWFFVRFAERN